MNYYQQYGDDFKPIDVEQEISSNVQVQMRLGLIRNAYGVLTAQLLLTTIFSGLACLSQSVKTFLLTHVGLFYIMLIVAIILPFVIVCCPGIMRQVPQNYFILFAFTFAESYLVAMICCVTNPSIVFMAAFMTFCLCVSLTIYAITTKTDITTKGGLLFILCCAFIMFSLFGLFTSNKFFHILLCCLGIILFGFYLLYDTQLIIGTKSELIETDDYILGSFHLYIDIINIFLQLLDLLRMLNSDN